MTGEKLRHGMQEGVMFWGVEEGGSLQAVMGIIALCLTPVPGPGGFWRTLSQL